MKAACMGCNSSPLASPSIVVISPPCCIRARVNHKLMRRPLMCTVHAPHWPWSHPFFEPVRCKCSRRQSRSVVRGSIRKSYFFPFTRRVTGIAPSSSGVDCAGDSARAGSPIIGRVETSKPAIPNRERNVRRVDFANWEPPSNSAFSSFWFWSDIEILLQLQLYFSHKRQDEPLSRHSLLPPLRYAL